MTLAKDIGRSASRCRKRVHHLIHRVQMMLFLWTNHKIHNDKKLIVEMYEKQGGRHQSFDVENEDLVRAETVNELKVR